MLLCLRFLRTQSNVVFHLIVENAYQFLRIVLSLKVINFFSLLLIHIISYEKSYQYCDSDLVTNPEGLSDTLLVFGALH